MDARPPPYHAHPRPQSRPLEAPQYAIPPSPYGAEGPRIIPPPPPTLQQDPFLRPQRQTFESIAASTPRPETRQTHSYPPAHPGFNGQADTFQRDARDGHSDRREGYGLKRSYDQAMTGEQVENGRPDSRRLHYDLASASLGHQHPPPYPQNGQPHVPVPQPGPANQHAPEHQKLGNGIMYQASAPLSPPPPSPYGGRSMHPPGSPQYAQPQYSTHGPHGPQPPPPPPPPHFMRDPGASSHRSGSSMSLASIMGGELPRHIQEPRYQTSNGGVQNGHLYAEREGEREAHPYPSLDGRSRTPDRYGSRQYDYTRPSRAFSTGERMPDPLRSPDKYDSHPRDHHDAHVDPRAPPPLPPHSSAPGSRRQSIGGAPPTLMSRPQTSVGSAASEPLHHLPGPPPDHLWEHREYHRDSHRPPPPPMPPVSELNGGPLHGPPERRIWEQDPNRQQYREEFGPIPRPQNHPFPSAVPQHHMQPASNLQHGPEPMPHHVNGNGPIYGPITRPPNYSPETERRLAADIHKHSLEHLPNHHQARLESPLLRHRHLMDRTNSNRSEHTPSRLLSVSAEDRRRAASPLPQAVQGAQAPSKGPASEPGIKNEFGRMFSGLGGVTPTPTPVELAHKRYSSPADEGGRSTPGLGRLDLSAKRANSRTGRHKRNRDDGLEPDLGSPTSSFNNKGLKRSRNSYMEGLGIHRADTGSPFGAGRRGFTPTSFGHHAKRERKPRTIVRSQPVLDAVKSKPRKHLGSLLYELHVEKRPGFQNREATTQRYGFDVAPHPIPRFEDKDNCTFSIRIPRECLTKDARSQVCARRNLWGAEVYTDDTDPLAAAIHSGWILGEWGADVDISMLSIGKEKEKEREGRINSNAIGPNGRTSLSVSVSPELTRKTLAPYGNGIGAGNTSGSDQGASRKSSDVGISGDEKDAGILTSVPAYPVVPPADKDAHITLLLLPRLQSYASTVQNGVKSRPWTTEHDGISFMVHSVSFVNEGAEGRRTGRGAVAKHGRLQDREVPANGVTRKFKTFSRNMSGSVGVGVVAAVGA